MMTEAKGERGSSRDTRRESGKRRNTIEGIGGNSRLEVESGWGRDLFEGKNAVTPQSNSVCRNFGKRNFRLTVKKV